MSRLPLYKVRRISLIRVMRDKPHYFQGRGKQTDLGDDNCRVIECVKGTVMAIVYTSHGCEFIQGYCRKAMIDRWGLYCDEVFFRASNATLTRFWAEPRPRGLFVFRPTRLEFTPEQMWMRNGKPK